MENSHFVGWLSVTHDHWHCQLLGTGACAPSTSKLFNFYGQFCAAQLWHWTPCGCLPRKNIQAYSFVTVYCM